MFDVTSIPPCPSTYDLPDRWIVVTFANVVAEHLSRLLWLDAGILLIQDSIDLYKHLLVDCVKEIWHFQGFLVKDDSITSWDWHLEVFEQLNYLLI